MEGAFLAEDKQMLSHSHTAAMTAYRRTSLTTLAACTIVSFWSFSSSAFAQATGACCNQMQLCGDGRTEAQCLAGGGHYFGDGSFCAMPTDEGGIRTAARDRHL